MCTGRDGASTNRTVAGGTEHRPADRSAKPDSGRMHHRQAAFENLTREEPDFSASYIAIMRAFRKHHSEPDCSPKSPPR
jgi:hypothetical protein